MNGTDLRSDEDFARDLRARLDAAAPRIEVNTHGVVPAARRRRRRRRALGLATVTLAAVGVGWSAQAFPWALWTDPLPAAQPVIDQVEGTITMPLDEWQLTLHELVTIRTADEHFVATCLQDAGYPVTFDGPVVLEHIPYEAQFGVWRDADVVDGAYSALSDALRPLDDADDGGINLDAMTPPDGEKAQALADCHAERARAGLTFDPGAADVPTAPTGTTPATDTKKGRAIIAEWKQCMVDAGVGVPLSEGLGPLHADDWPGDMQKRVAAVDVACKQKLGTVRKLAELDARDENEYLARGGREYLGALLDAQQEVLARATAYLAEHGVTVP